MMRFGTQKSNRTNKKPAFFYQPNKIILHLLTVACSVDFSAVQDPLLLGDKDYSHRPNVGSPFRLLIVTTDCLGVFGAPLWLLLGCFS